MKKLICFFICFAILLAFSSCESMLNTETFFETSSSEVTEGKFTQDMASPTLSLPKTMPSDFNIRYEYWTDHERKNVYDTYSDTIVKDLIDLGTVSVSFAHDNADLEKIYEKVIEYNICAINYDLCEPEFFKHKGIEQTRNVFPCSFYYFKITVNGKTYEIIANDDVCMFYKKEYKDVEDFCAFRDFMMNVYRNTPEYKELPDHVGGYQ